MYVPAAPAVTHAATRSPVAALLISMILDLVPTAESKGYACRDREIGKDFGDPEQTDRPVFRICPLGAVARLDGQCPMPNAQTFSLRIYTRVREQ
jgi:hypothetical protein